jgi:hypothetical protein
MRMKWGYDDLSTLSHSNRLLGILGDGDAESALVWPSGSCKRCGSGDETGQ